MIDRADDLVPEATVLACLRAFEGYQYKRKRGKVSYPYQLPGLTLPDPPPRRNDCSTFVEGLVVGAWAEANEGFVWSNERHDQMMVSDEAAYPFSPITALVDTGIARAVPDSQAPPAPWTVIQAWDATQTTGHALIVVAYHPPTDRILTLESTNGHRLNGVGFRNFGNLESVDAGPPHRWWEEARAPTWTHLLTERPLLMQARLGFEAADWTKTA